MMIMLIIEIINITYTYVNMFNNYFVAVDKNISKHVQANRTTTNGTNSLVNDNT